MLLRRRDIYTFLSGLEQVREVLTTVQISSIALYNFLSFNNQTSEPTLLIEVGVENTNLMIIDKDKFWIRNVPSSDVGDTFVSEIKRTIGYYISLVKEIKIKKLIVAGSVVEQVKKQFIADNLGLELVEIFINKTIEISSPVNKQKFDKNKADLSVALGLTMQGLSIGRININLVPEEYAKKVALSSKKKFVLLSSITILFSVFILYFSFRLENERIESYASTKLSVLTKATAIDKQFNKVNKKFKTISNKADQIISVRNGRTFWFKVLPKIINSMPDDIQLSKLDSKWLSPKEKTLLISLKGKSYNPELGFIGKMVKEPLAKMVTIDKDKKEINLFEDVNIVPDSLNDDTDGITFEIQWKVKLDLFYLLSSNNGININDSNVRVNH